MTTAIKAPSKYVQGAGELKNLGLNAKRLGSRFYVLCSERGRQRFGKAVEESLQGQEKETVFGVFAGEATKDEVAAHTGACKNGACDVVVGLGGGKVIDTAKAVADGLDLPCVIIPTVASNDAPCSGVAVLYNEQGVVVKAVITKRNPDLVLVDTQIIAETPARLFVAGMGDALATWFEARACLKTKAKNMARGLQTQAATAIAKLCYDILLKHGEAAVESVKAKTVTQEVEQVVEASILLSGIGFESGGLAAAHAVNDGFAQEPQAHDALHGEKVAFGVLVQLVLEKASRDELGTVLSFMKRVGLPTKLADLGVKEINPETLRKVAEAACVPTQSTKNLSPDITADDVYQAILAVNAL